MAYYVSNLKELVLADYAVHHDDYGGDVNQMLFSWYDHLILFIIAVYLCFIK